MEALGIGLQALGGAIGSCASAVAVIYVAGIAAKTFLIFMNKGSDEVFKNWFSFRGKGRGL